MAPHANELSLWFASIAYALMCALRRIGLADTVELRRNSVGRTLMARIYQPKGMGPFPTVLHLHGGAWNRNDRLAEEQMDRALGASGLLVVCA
jgi:acetyl esterase/lipase